MNQQKLFHTTNLKAATALLTLGFKKITISRIVRKDGKESIVFWFEGENESGEDAESVFEGMTTKGEELAQKDPENVVNYLRAFAANRDELIADIKATPRMVTFTKDGRKISISENASEDLKSRIAAIL